MGHLVKRKLQAVRGQGGETKSQLWKANKTTTWLGCSRKCQGSNKRHVESSYGLDQSLSGCYLLFSATWWENMPEHQEASSENWQEKPLKRKKKRKKKKLSKLFGWAGHKHEKALKEASHCHLKKDEMSNLSIHSSLTWCGKWYLNLNWDFKFLYNSILKEAPSGFSTSGCKRGRKKEIKTCD